MPIITLLSDFGTKDSYVGQMKGVILSICPNATIVDISHEIEKFNVRAGAFVLASAVSCFPRGTIHLAVVDPGVGMERRAIIIKSKSSIFVGPDNGILVPAAEREGIEHVYQIRNERYILPKVSRTFHGRDVFAPVAAFLANGVRPREIGPEIKDYKRPSFTRPKVVKGNFTGEILYIDGFGNIITNASTSLLEKMEVKEGDLLKIKMERTAKVVRFCRAYGEVPKHELLAIIGSSDFLEISINQGNAAEFFNVRPGNKLWVTKAS